MVGTGETLNFAAFRNQSGRYWCSAENGIDSTVNASAYLNVLCKCGNLVSVSMNTSPLFARLTHEKNCKTGAIYDKFFSMFSCQSEGLKTNHVNFSSRFAKSRLKSSKPDRQRNRSRNLPLFCHWQSCATDNVVQGWDDFADRKRTELYCFEESFWKVLVLSK